MYEGPIRVGELYTCYLDWVDERSMTGIILYVNDEEGTNGAGTIAILYQTGVLQEMKVYRFRAGHIKTGELIQHPTDTFKESNHLLGTKVDWEKMHKTIIDYSLDIRSEELFHLFAGSLGMLALKATFYLQEQEVLYYLTSVRFQQDMLDAVRYSQQYLRRQGGEEV